MDTIRTTETECSFCGKGLSRRGKGQHEKNCEHNPANAKPSEGDALRAKIVRQAEAKIDAAHIALGDAEHLLCEADPADEPEWQAKAAEKVGEALTALRERAALIDLLKPEGR